MCLREGDEWKTTFCMRYGHFKYLVMLFGLTYALATFQRFINNVFQDTLDHYIADDILVFSDNLEPHTGHIQVVLER